MAGLRAAMSLRALSGRAAWALASAAGAGRRNARRSPGSLGADIVRPLAWAAGKRGQMSGKADHTFVDPGTSFEDARAEMARIIESIESGRAGLEESVALSERGAALYRHCRAILDRAEQRFTDLTGQMQAGEGPRPG